MKIRKPPSVTVAVNGRDDNYLLLILLILTLLALPVRVNAFSYIFAGDGPTDGDGLYVNLVTHSIGYSGSGGSVNITVGIDNTSIFSNQMLIPVQNIVNTWNGLVPTTNNLISGASNNIPTGLYDFESVALHEVGHSLGLGHTNLASESGYGDPEANYTNSTKGTDNNYNIAAGTDGVIGSADDSRGDDQNLNWFRMSNNNPFTIDSTIDSTTYSRDISNLPGGSFSANASRDVAGNLGFGNSEAVMQQGTYADEAQRTLGHDDVAGIRYAMAGLDEIAGTSDDYQINLQYIGLTTAADILLDFDNAETAFAASSSTGYGPSGNHTAIFSTSIYFNDTADWFFNDQSNAVPIPGSVVLLASGVLGLLGWGRRRK